MSIGELRFEGAWTVEEPAVLVEWLAERTPLSRNRLKDAMNKGAVWLRRGRHEKRVRRARLALRRGDRVSIHYDGRILAGYVEAPTLVADPRDYSVWDKPPGMLSQGSRFGDHLSLMRWLEQVGFPERRHWLVHRLDREASGLILVAHQPKVAAALSAMFEQGRVEKRYQVEVRLDAERREQLQSQEEWVLDEPLDGKRALTRVSLLKAAQQPGENDQLEIRIETGRKHQIRRHLSQAGYPVLGDPRYGNAESQAQGLRLRACYLSFECPVSRRPVSFSVQAP